MIVSWNWLKKYVALDVPPGEVERRLMLAGLNHESTEKVGDDLAIDLEVTSNRPDCLGHHGVAREAAVLFDVPLTLPAAAPAEAGRSVTGVTSVEVMCPDLCPRYTARVIRGVKITASPRWMQDRLATIGIAAINNVADITNYVLMECGQPLHAFDLDRLHGQRIVVRRAARAEPFVAINHKTYELDVSMCVIADGQRPVALGGVMGGADTEVGPATKNVLLESAEFAPLSIRNTARRLNLHSPSSYRFERGLDPEGVDWASRRACELILELAGGELASGVIDVGAKPGARPPIVLRLAQLKRILGIEIDAAEVRRILAALGNRELRATDHEVEVLAPSWRRDLTREIDLVEEVARIHGYDAIPEDVSVPMAPSTRTIDDRVLAKIRHVLTAAGFDEALTLSAVDEQWSELFSPWTDAAPLKAQIPVMRRAEYLRRSLVPSLLGARRTNESLSNARIELFEIANVYLPQPAGLPGEEKMLALSSGRSFGEVKGAIEALVRRLDPAAELTVRPLKHDLLASGEAAELWLGGERIGVLGVVSGKGQKAMELRGASTVAELRLPPLIAAAKLVPLAQELSAFPAISRDLNFVVDERVSWADLAATARKSGGPYLESLEYRDTYRDAERLGPTKKSLLLSLSLRRPDATLTGEEADAIRDAVVNACEAGHAAKLRA